MKKFFNIFQKISKFSSNTEPKIEKKDEIIKPNEKAVKCVLKNLYSPIEGEVIELNNVPEGAFSQKLLGDGFAIIPSGNKVFSPADGEVAVLFPTKHAVVILTEEGLEILIHVGINTASLNGEGFMAHVEKGTKVNKGDLLITFDNEVVKTNGKSLISPIIITNINLVKDISIDFGNKKALEKVADVILM